MTHGWFFWLVASVFVIGPLTTVLSIGDERKPITREVAALSVLVNAAFLFLLFQYWGK